MSNRRQIFRQADIARALKAALGVGLRVARVEIGADGKIVIVSENATPAPVGPSDDFDKWKAEQR